MEAYVYQPLATAKSTRLIEFLPSHNDDRGTINCKMYEISLDEVPQTGYTALSYCWGSSTRDASIVLEGRWSLPVTKNLWAALQVLHRGGGSNDDNDNNDDKRFASSPFWIDAICINQDDLDERALQVRQMRRVFEQASRIAVWLGDKTPDSAVAMRTIAAVDEARRAHESAGVAPLMATYAITNDPSPLFGVVRGGDDDDDDDERKSSVVDVSPLEALARLLMRPWFERVWIVQEATIPSKSMTVFCGEDCVEWSALTFCVSTGNETVTRPQTQDASRVQPFSNRSLRRLFNLEKLRQIRNQGMGFMEILARYRHFKATDPRDKVFALRDLAADLPEYALIPDYTVTHQSLFTQAAEHLIMSKKSYECLGYCSLIDRDAGMPSWAPDWVCRTSRHPLAKRKFHDNHEYTESVYHALTLESESQRRMMWNCTISDGLMKVSGFTVDTIDRVIPFNLPPEGDAANRGREKHHCYDEKSEWGCALFGARVPEADFYRDTTEPLRLAYSRTLVADVCKKGSSRTRGYHVSLDYWSSVRNPLPAPVDKRLRIEWGSLLFHIVERCIFWTSDGYLGLGPEEAQPGDRVCAFFGGDVFYLLRPLDGGAGAEVAFLFVGEVYVHGLMDGEAFSLFEAEKRPTETFAIR